MNNIFITQLKYFEVPRIVKKYFLELESHSLARYIVMVAGRLPLVSTAVGGGVCVCVCVCGSGGWGGVCDLSYILIRITGLN